MAIVLTLLGYLIGSVSSAIIVSRLMRLPDPRSEGSGNPGATNVLRLGGKKAAAITLAFDIFKGIVPVVIATSLTNINWIIALCGFAAFLGHLFPVFFGFKGGKGVATALGVYLGFSVGLGVAAIAVWLFVALASRFSSLGSLTAVTLTPVMASISPSGFSYILICLLIGALVFWRHKENIKRLTNGTESKINLGS